jgi:hypothetical protein
MINRCRLLKYQKPARIDEYRFRPALSMSEPKQLMAESDEVEYGRGRFRMASDLSEKISALKRLSKDVANVLGTSPGASDAALVTVLQAERCDTAEEPGPPQRTAMECLKPL